MSRVDQRCHEGPSGPQTGRNGEQTEMRADPPVQAGQAGLPGFKIGIKRSDFVPRITSSCVESIRGARGPGLPRTRGYLSRSHQVFFDSLIKTL